jgi:hypothetical protein
MTGIKRTSTDPATLPAVPMTEAQFGALNERLLQQPPWGPGDQRRALTDITSAEVLAARSRVRLGRVIPLAAPVEHQATADNPDPAQDHTKEPLAMERRQGAGRVAPDCVAPAARAPDPALGGDGNNDTAPIQS